LTGQSRRNPHHPFLAIRLSSSGALLEKARIRRSSTIFRAFSYIFRDMPGATPRTLISAQFLWRIGSRNPVCRGRQRFTFGSVFPFPADRTFRFVVHHEPFRRFLVNYWNLILARHGLLVTKTAVVSAGTITVPLCELNVALKTTTICWYRPKSGPLKLQVSAVVSPKA
jgi:hypothetical protein